MPTDTADSPVTPRVKIVQAQARSALRLAVAFALAASITTVVPHDTGAWLPLHLFLVGTLGLAISGATRLFAVTWSAGEPSHPTLVAVQRWLLAIGTGGLAAGREFGAPTALTAGAGLCVTAALALLGFLLIADVRHARVQRFNAALRYYLAAVVAGLVGTALGAAMVTGHAGLRDAHVTVNLLGFVGLVIAGTLPSFTATQARMKLSPRATPRRLQVNLAWLSTAIALAAIGALTGSSVTESAGLFAYAAGVLHLLSALPRPGRKQLAWAGPRLVQLGAGIVWWTATVAVAGGQALDTGVAFDERLVVALVLGGYAQILLASLAYLGPVLRGGGHQRLTAGFETTRSWLALAAGNIAGIAWLIGNHALTVIAIGVLAIDLTARAGRLALGHTTPRTRHEPPQEPVGV